MTYSCISCKHIRRIPAPPVLIEDTEKDESAAQPQEVQEDNEEDVMDVEVSAPASGSKTATAGDDGVGAGKWKQREKRRPVPKPLPFFQRKGHVVFRGNEKLSDES